MGERERVQRRTLRVLVAGQVLAGAGLAAGITVGALLAEDLLGSTGLAGLPAALLTGGSAGAALLVGRVSQARGRRVGLAGGYLVGAAGAVGVVAAAVLGSAALLLVSLVVYGAGTATNLQARYAGADLATVGERGRAISRVLFATTLGAVAGPNLVGPMRGVAAALGIPELAGPFLLGAAAYGLAGGTVLWLLRPDPLLVARSAPAPEESVTTAGPMSSRDGGSVALGATAMVLTQLVMVAIMTMTPIHMRDHGHGLVPTGLVIGLHVAGMYLPSPLTGRLVDRFGRRAAMAAGAVVLLLAGVVAATAPPESVPLLAVGLGLLGLGWNLGLISGTAMVTDAAAGADAPRVQGRVDLLVALAGAAGGLSSGAIVAVTSYATLAIAGGGLALLLLPVVARRPRLG